MTDPKLRITGTLFKVGEPDMNGTVISPEAARAIVEQIKSGDCKLEVDCRVLDSEVDPETGVRTIKKATLVGVSVVGPGCGGEPLNLTREERPMKKICYFDVETTGLDPEKAAIHQLAMILEKDGKVVQEKNWRIMPHEGAEIHDKALAVSGVTRADIMDPTKYEPPAHVWHDICNTFDSFVNPRDPGDKMIACGYNAKTFDVPFLRAFVGRQTIAASWSVYGSYFQSAVVLDPLPVLQMMTLAGFQDGIVHDDFDPVNWKLSTVCKDLGITLDNAHDAMADIRATRELVRGLMKRLAGGSWGIQG